MRVVRADDGALFVVLVRADFPLAVFSYEPATSKLARVKTWPDDLADALQHPG